MSIALRCSFERRTPSVKTEFGAKTICFRSLEFPFIFAIKILKFSKRISSTYNWDEVSAYFYSIQFRYTKPFTLPDIRTQSIPKKKHPFVKMSTQLVDNIDAKCVKNDVRSTSSTMFQNSVESLVESQHKVTNSYFNGLQINDSVLLASRG